MADTCSSLAAEIAALRAEIARIPKVDEKRIINATRSALQPDISTAVAGGVVLVTNKLQPKINDAFTKGKEALEKAFKVETVSNNAQREALKATNEALRASRDNASLESKIRRAQSTADTGVEIGNGATKSAGEAKRIGNNAFDKAGFAEQKAALSAAQAERAKRAADAAGDIAAIAKRESSLASGLANQAKNTANTAIGNAAKASKDALEAAGEVTGLKGVVNGVKSRVGALGELIVKVEGAAMEALGKAAKAIGLSEQALASTLRLAGRIVEIFNILATIFTLIEQLATLNVLGGRIDAVERAVDRLGADVSGILGRLLGLRNRIERVEGDVGIVRGIATYARSIAEAANLKAGSAQIAATRAQGTADTAIGNARQAQTTADGAVRNAKQANENATTAYKKAVGAESIAEQAKRLGGQALSKAGEALSVGLTALALYQTFKGLRGLKGDPGIPGRQGERGFQGVPGIPGRAGRDGVTTVVQIPGAPGPQGERGLPGLSGLPGRNGRDGLPGRDGKDGKDVSPAEAASLRTLIIAQHTQTRANSTAQHQGTRTTILTPIMAALAPILALLKQIYDAVMAISNAAILALLNVINTKLGAQVTGGLSQFIKTIAENTYLEKALSVLTFAATMHNALMLSNNVGQTLISIIDQVTAFLLPKGVDGTPINFSESLGKTVKLVIESAIGEENYRELSEDWAKANRIYQATCNVFNQVTQLGGLITTGLEVVGGNVGKIGNALRKGGVLLENAYQYMNPQPNLQGKFFSFMNTANEKLSSIATVVAITIAFKEVIGGINLSRAELSREISQTDPKDTNGNPIRNDKGEIVRYKPGFEVPTPIVEEAKGEQAKADSTNFIGLVLEDIFDGGD